MSGNRHRILKLRKSKNHGFFHRLQVDYCPGFNSSRSFAFALINFREMGTFQRLPLFHQSKKFMKNGLLGLPDSPAGNTNSAASGLAKSITNRQLGPTMDLKCPGCFLSFLQSGSIQTNFKKTKFI